MSDRENEAEALHRDLQDSPCATQYHTAVALSLAEQIPIAGPSRDHEIPSATSSGSLSFAGDAPESAFTKVKSKGAAKVSAPARKVPRMNGSSFDPIRSVRQDTQDTDVQMRDVEKLESSSSRGPSQPKMAPLSPKAPNAYVASLNQSYGRSAAWVSGFGNSQGLIPELSISAHSLT